MKHLRQLKLKKDEMITLNLCNNLLKRFLYKNNFWNDLSKLYWEKFSKWFYNLYPPGLEGVLVEEADKIGDLFRSKQNEPFLVLNLFNVAILNVLWTIVANHRYVQFSGLLGCIQEIIRGRWFCFFPGGGAQ